ncbi:MAG: hypothetical protein ACK5AL_08305 [Planctomycetota bacterium]
MASCSGGGTGSKACYEVQDAGGTKVGTLTVTQSDSTGNKGDYEYKDNAGTVKETGTVTKNAGSSTAGTAKSTDGANIYQVIETKAGQEWNATTNDHPSLKLKSVNCP